MFEQYDIPSIEEMQFEGEKLIAPVVVQKYEEQFQGTAHGEEYVDEQLVSTETVSVELPLTYVYEDKNPSVEYSGEDAKSFLNNNIIEDVEIKDPETVELYVNGTKYIANYSAVKLDDYQ